MVAGRTRRREGQTPQQEDRTVVATQGLLQAGVRLGRRPYVREHAYRADVDSRQHAVEGRPLPSARQHTDRVLAADAARRPGCKGRLGAL